MSLDADRGPEQREESDLGEERFCLGDRSFQPQDDAGFGPKLLCEGHCAQASFTVLGMNADEIGARFDELACLLLDNLGLDH